MFWKNKANQCIVSVVFLFVFVRNDRNWPFDVYFKKTNLCQLKLHLTFKRYKHIYQEMAYPASKEWENDHSYP